MSYKLLSIPNTGETKIYQAENQLASGCSNSSCFQRTEKSKPLFFFLNKVSWNPRRPPTCRFELNFWSSWPQLPRVGDYRQVPPCPFFYWVLGIETRPLCMENKHSANWTTPPFWKWAFLKGKRGSSDLLEAEKTSQTHAGLLIKLIHSQPPVWMLWSICIVFLSQTWGS